MRIYLLVFLGVLSLASSHAQKHADYQDAVQRLHDFSIATDTSGLKDQVNRLADFSACV